MLLGVPCFAACHGALVEVPAPLDRSGTEVAIVEELDADQYYVGFGMHPPFASTRGWVYGPAFEEQEQALRDALDARVEITVMDGDERQVFQYSGFLGSDDEWTVSTSSPHDRWPGSIVYRVPSFTLPRRTRCRILLKVEEGNAAAAAWAPAMFVASVPEWQDPPAGKVAPKKKLDKNKLNKDKLNKDKLKRRPTAKPQRKSKPKTPLPPG